MITLRERRGWAVDFANSIARRRSLTKHCYPNACNIGYIGWTVGENLGDGAMFEAAQRLCSPTELFQGVRREAVLAKFGLSGPRVFQHLYLGGGTLINDGHLGLVEKAIDLGLEISTLGTGVGSSGFATSDECVNPKWHHLLTQFKKVGVRGPVSAQKLTNIGVRNVQIIGDLAMALTPDKPLGHLRHERFILNAAAPTQPDRHYPNDLVITALAQATKLLTELGWRPVPIAMCQDDIEPIRQVLRDAQVEATIEQPRTSQAFFNLARGAGIAIGVRLHCAVLSSCAGVVPLTVAYREKGLDFARSMNICEWTLQPQKMSATDLAERAEALATPAGANIGLNVHQNALQWRAKLRGYVADAP